MNEQTVKTKLFKRVGSIAISDMEPKYQEVEGKLVKLCLNGCGKPIPKGNRKYCSIECSNEFFAKHNQHGIADLIFKRENGTCQKCGWQNPVYRNIPVPKYPQWNDPEAVGTYRKALEEYERLCDEQRKQRRSFVADHIIPIALGGEEFTLSNIQLLCEVCNKKKTKADMARIANVRKTGLRFSAFWKMTKNTLPLSVFLSVSNINGFEVSGGEQGKE